MSEENQVEAAPEEEVRDRAPEHQAEKDEAASASGDEETGKANFMDPKYRNRKPIQDFIADLVADQCWDYEKDKDGNNIGKPSLNVDAVCDLGEANGMPCETLRSQKDRRNAPGRIRMSVVNGLRARARKRFGIYDLHGEWVDAPEEFTEGLTRTQGRDGAPLSTPKAQNQEQEVEGETAIA